MIKSDVFAFTRRAVLGWASAAPLLVSCSREDADQQDLDSFMQLSSVLTGFETRELDRELAKLLRVRLMARGFGSQLQSADPDKFLDAEPNLAVEIIEAWYTGIHIVGNSPVVATFTKAKIWDAAGFAAVPTVCEGQLGTWAKPADAALDDQTRAQSNS